MSALQTSTWTHHEMITVDKQIHTCLFAHECIIVGEEGSELCRSVGQDFEDIRQKASLFGNAEFCTLTVRQWNNAAVPSTLMSLPCTFDSTSSMSSTMSLGSSFLLGTG